MTTRISQAALLLFASFAPVSVSADSIELSDVRISARASFSSQQVPEKSDFDVKVAPPDQLLQAAQALVIDGLPFPNQPNSQNAGFASSTAVVGGLFGVGVNGFHFQNSLPPNRYFASGTWTQTLTNNSALTQVSTGTISVPAPTIRFFGVGNSFPTGANPDLDASAAVNIRLFSILTLPMATRKKQSTLSTVCTPCAPRSSECSWQTRPTMLWGHSRVLTSPTARSDFVCCL